MTAADAVRALGQVLAAAGYDEDGLRHAAGGLPPRRAAGLRRHGALPGAGAPVDIFHFGISVARDALPRLDLDALAAEGLVTLDGELVRPLAQITPWLGLLVAHDPDGAAAPRPGHVPGANTSGDTLARATVRLPVASALDLGAGSGVHALLAAGHAGRVTAVDVNPRALHYVALNARLNGLDNVDARTGSWLEPVAGERFDLVVCNPPYVLSPDREYLFRDGGEGLAERLVRTIPAHLTEGGLGHVLCNWATRAGESPWQAVEEWTRTTGCDVLAVALSSEGVVSYAARWAEPPGPRDETGYAERVRRWLDYYAESGIETIWLGLVLLRRRAAAPNWFRGLGATGPLEGSASAHLQRIVAAQDWLAAVDRPPLLAERLRLAPGHTIVRETSDGSSRAAITLDEGLGVHGAVDPGALPVVERLDGGRPLGEVVAEVAADPHSTSLTVLHLLELGLVERT